MKKQRTGGYREILLRPMHRPALTVLLLAALSSCSPGSAQMDESGLPMDSTGAVNPPVQNPAEPDLVQPNGPVAPVPSTPSNPAEPSAPVVPTEPSVEPLKPAQPNSSKDDVAAPKLGIPAWGTSSGRTAWTKAVRAVVEARMKDFNRAQDVELFCPDYQKASYAEQVNCWVLIVAAMAKFESNFKSSTTFLESNGVDSIGMLQLSEGECPNAKTARELQDPVQNLICGTNIMAKLISRGENIDGPASRRGASRYWSTLRNPYKQWNTRLDRTLSLGRKPDIIALSKKYRGNQGDAGNWIDPKLKDDDASEPPSGEFFERDEDVKRLVLENNDDDFFEPRDIRED